MWVNEMWLLVTALIFTAYGWWMGVKNNSSHITALVIDSLIDEGYLRTRKNGDEIEILKWNEK